MNSAPCKCEYPYLTVTASVRINSPKKPNGEVAVVRYLDCVFHGPSHERMNVYPEMGSPLNKRSGVDIVAPAHIMNKPFQRKHYNE